MSKKTVHVEFDFSNDEDVHTISDNLGFATPEDFFKRQEEVGKMLRDYPSDSYGASFVGLYSEGKLTEQDMALILIRGIQVIL